MVAYSKAVSSRISHAIHQITAAFVLAALLVFAYASSARADFQSDITEAAKKSEVRQKFSANLKLKNPKAENRRAHRRCHHARS